VHALLRIGFFPNISTWYAESSGSALKQSPGCFFATMNAASTKSVLAVPTIARCGSGGRRHGSMTAKATSTLPSQAGLTASGGSGKEDR
jgi:hypothetical protein